MNEAHEGEAADPDARCRCGCGSARAARARHRDRAGAGASTPTARRCPRRSRCSSVIARHGLVLATGHLGRDEIFAVVDAARRAGREDDRGDPPGVPVAGPRVDDQRALAERGALLERCFTTPHTGKIAGTTCFENIRASGAEHSVLSTDLGQVFNPPVEDGLALMVDRLLGGGLRRRGGAHDGRENTRRVAGGGAVSARLLGDRRALGGLRLARRRRRRGGRRAAAWREVIALSYGERGESGELWKEPGQTVENVKRDPPRRGRARGRRPRRRRSAASTSATTRSRSTASALLRDRRRDPRVRARRADHPHRHRPLQPRSSGRLHGGRPRARAWPPARACRAPSRRSSRRRSSSSSRTSPSCATSRRRRSSTSPPVLEQKVAAMAEMKAQSYLQTYYEQRGEQRGNHARRASGNSDVRFAEAFQRVTAAGGERAVSAARGAGAARRRRRSTRRPAGAASSTST